MGSGFMTAHGGKGANQAVAAARLGAQVKFMTCLGKDAFGDLLREGLVGENIQLASIKPKVNLPTGTAMIFITESGENAIVVDPGANHALCPQDIINMREDIQKADVVITQLEIPLEVVEAILLLARENNVFSILDAGPARQLSPALVAAADLVSPNESEAKALTGITVDSLKSARLAAQCLLDMGTPHVVMKLGARGCLYAGREEYYQPAFQVNAVDTTGAGDAFTAALGVAWGTVPLADALRFANAAGALAATVTGAQPSMPTVAAVETFLREH